MGLVIAGAHELMAPPYIEPLAEGLPDAELVVFESSGAFAPVVDPEASRETVFSFLGVASR